MISNEMRDRLIAMAREASRNAYVPYSHFKVGAAILGEKGGEAAPCGACRQFMLEFADEALEAPLYFAGRDGSFVTSSFQEICPFPFRSFAGND